MQLPSTKPTLHYLDIGSLGRGEHLAILRYLARELGEYDGNTSLEKYFLDAVADVYNDWRIQWVNNLGNVTDKFRNEVVPNYYNVLARFYAQQEGPYLLGERITYTDFLVYQSIDNDSQTGTLPVSSAFDLLYLHASLTCGESF
ncbi:hypothetical protein AO1008_02452 [Aspergillus oryzae 100-8]|uniref:Glutathione S-transferase C-terminal domain-containing protein n=1 Tax=Aspergillus oryzae (strain 3.042) TaxID=1160506 RepID=I8IQH1_ASPO3|nr:hypothetical protein Ao3042_01846 [Aspergillus oryzae 3.042]KDE76577.1 hypothetical protein AO1008_02452 [Aspergillus oryzae 100-8]|eukprot:EIT81621.1 hypothetical protein Ao3042_01846 [Aspergillus oryzae 3.042]